MGLLLRLFYRLLITLACVSMATAFVIVMLGILARQVSFIDIQGLDAYAGYAIAATLFFALPTALMHGDHIRVTLVLDRMGIRARAGFEWGALIAGLGLSGYLAWFAVRAVWLSYTTHDISPGSDATPLWIPQLCMAIGCVAFALAFLDAIVARWRGREWFIAGPGSVAE